MPARPNHFLSLLRVRPGPGRTGSTAPSRPRSLLPVRARQWTRHNSSNSSSSSSSSSSAPPNTSPSSPKPPRPSPSTRADRILSRLPPRLQKYARRLRSAPVSHVAAFLVLHEATAVVPLLGLFGLFHYYADRAPLLVPVDYVVGSRWGAGYVGEGAARFERYFRRKGWFGFGAEEGEGEGEGGKERGKLDGEGEGEKARDDEDGGADSVMKLWQGADAKYKIVVEVALAYAITKALLPVRIALSLWATPWFAGVLVKTRRLFGRRRT